MAFIGDHYWYVDGGDGSTTGYYAVTQWAVATLKVCGNVIRPANAFGVTAGNERCYVAISSAGGTGVTGGSSPPFNGGAVIARGAKNTDNQIVWQECSGVPAMNGDSVNAPNWNAVKNLAVSLGLVIQNNARNLTLICTTAGTTSNGAEPSWAAYTAAGATTNDGTAVWTTLGGVTSSWANPFAHASIPLNRTNGWGVDGHVAFVASEHNDANVGVFNGSGIGTLALPTYVVCVNKSNVPPTSANVTTGAIIGSASTFVMGVSATQQVIATKGIAFKSNGGSFSFRSGQNSYWRFDDSDFDKSADATNSLAGNSFNFNIDVTNDVPDYLFNNTRWKFGAVNQAIIGTPGGGGYIRWKGGSIAASGTVPTKLFNESGGAVGVGNVMLLEGVDLSAINTNLFDAAFSGKAVLKNCKTNVGVNVVSAVMTAPWGQVDIIHSDATNNYRVERHNASGDQTTETTIVRTGGATDGAQQVSWKIVTSTLANWLFPFECLPIFGRAIAGVPITVTVYGIWGGGAVPNNDQIFFEACYLNDSGSPIGTLVNTTKSDFLATGSAVSSDTSTWGGSTTKFKMTASVTPQKSGPVAVYIRAAAASQTFYVDPKVGGIAGNP